MEPILKQSGSRGQWLSLPLILTGIAVLIWVWRPSHRERAV